MGFSIYKNEMKTILKIKLGINIMLIARFLKQKKYRLKIMKNEEFNSNCVIQNNFFIQY